MRGADHLVQCLKQASVEHIFALSGNQILPVFDACLDAGINIIHTRHEAAAVYMAEAHAQLTGRVGVALVAAGTGLANAIGPLVTARASDTPVLLISGDAPRSDERRGAFQEIDQVAITASLTKLSLRLRDPGEVGQACARALRVAASARPGPVHLCLPADTATGTAELPASTIALDFRPEAADPSTDGVVSVTSRIGLAARPLIILGPSLSSTRAPELEGLAGALDAPVICMESPRGVNDPALGKFASLLRDADLIVTLGKQVDFSLRFGAVGKPAHWIVVLPEARDLEQAAQNLGHRLDIGLRCDPRALALALLASATGAERRREWRARAARITGLRAQSDPVRGAITPADVTAAVQARIDAATEPVLVCDGGEFGQWAQAGLRAPARIVNGPSGAIGGAICYAIAARAARPGSQVFALMGDGTAGFHLAEFETAAREGLPFVAVVGNDRRWNAEHQLQLRDFGPDRLIGCELTDARYDLAAAALGGHGEYVTAPDQLEGPLARAVASGKPALVNVEIVGLPAPGVS